MTVGGWVKSYRTQLKHPLLQDADALGLWTRLTLMAAIAPTKILFRGNVVHLQRGQLAISVRDFAERGGMTRKRIRGLLAVWEKDGMLTTGQIGDEILEVGAKVGPKMGPKNEADEGPKTDGSEGPKSPSRGTVLTICNFDVYQAPAEDPETKRAQNPDPPRAQKLPHERTKVGPSIKNQESKNLESSGITSPPTTSRASPEEEDQEEPASSRDIAESLIVEGITAETMMDLDRTYRTRGLSPAILRRRVVAMVHEHSAPTVERALLQALQNSRANPLDYAQRVLVRQDTERFEARARAEVETEDPILAAHAWGMGRTGAETNGRRTDRTGDPEQPDPVAAFIRQRH